MSFQSLIIGVVHCFFGISLIILQIACFIMQSYYHQLNTQFEGRFGPGCWLGGFLLITGIVGIVHGVKDPETPGYHRLLLWVILLNILSAVLALIMLGLAIGWRILDPEGFLYKDCEFPFAPWIYYFPPHCETAYHVQIMGATMMAVAVFEFIFCLAAAIIVRKVDNDNATKPRRPYQTTYLDK
ncbi:hypothetical protein RvY_06557 [Ramazzottius varieornatus]|uniref:MARVEL domain-containing protein n=1 Tax=Ramazzottius varieornatus TaxID=947166 RepID=A0A1D1UZ13_RAMVA|nr:hypothetical protein RvY_06557 [Ramazzottius varieornatus]